MTVVKPSSVLIAAGFIGGLLLVGCVPTADFTDLRDDVREIQAENKKLKQSQVELRKRLDGSDTTTQAADMVRRLDVLEGALGDLKAKQLSLDQKLSALITQSEENARQVDAFPPRTEEAPKPAPPKTSTAKPVQPSDFETQAVLTPTASFNLAYNDYLKGNYDLAVAGFESFLRQFPSTSLAAHAQYWIGESHANKREYRPAVDAYERLITTYPKSDKVPPALYKAATGYAELGDLAKARSLYKRLIEEHPQSDEATRAKQRLAELR